MNEQSQQGPKSPPPTPERKPEAGNGVEGTYVQIDGTGGSEVKPKTETGKITPDGKYIPDNPQKPVSQ